MRPVKFKSFAVFCLFLIIFSLFFGCTPNEPAPVSVGPTVVGDELRSSTAVVHTPSAPETNVVGHDLEFRIARLAGELLCLRHKRGECRIVRRSSRCSFGAHLKAGCVVTPASLIRPE